MTADPYVVLGVSPQSEDVVVRAAYRALMQKYTSLARLDIDADDHRAREVQAAYDQLEAARGASPGATAVVAPPSDATNIPSHAPVEQEPAPPVQTLTPSRPRRSATGLAVAATALLAAGGAAAVWILQPLPAPGAAPRASLHVQLRHGPAATPLGRPLPCFVGGHAVGDMRLADCASRNGVASGPLELGLAAPLPPLPAPVPAVAAPQTKAPEPRVAAPSRPRAPQATPPAAPQPVRAEALGRLWRAAKAAVVRLAAAPPAAPKLPRPVKVSPAPHRAAPSYAALAAQDETLDDQVAALKRARHVASPVASAAPASPPKPAADPKGADHLDRLLAMLGPLVRPPAAPAPRPAPAVEAPPVKPAVTLVNAEAIAAPAAHPGAQESVEVVRDFYRALGEGDAQQASALIAPEARDAGSLSTERIRRFSSAVRQPLRLTGIRALDDGGVFVRYQFVSSANQLCEGSADVATTQRDARVMIRSIRTSYAC